MRYVGNLKKDSGNYFNTPQEKAVFPPESRIPDIVSEHSEMYRENDVFRPDERMNMDNSSDIGKNMNMEMEARPRMDMEIGSRANMQAGSRAEMEASPQMPQNQGMPQTDYRGNMGFVYRGNASNNCGTSRSIYDFLCEYMGKYISAEFLFGADTYVKKSGILTGTGMNYITLDTDDGRVVCDLTDVKFINVSSDDLR